jgi:nitroreductase
VTPDEALAIPGVDDVLTTTRAVRRRLDLERPVPREVIARCVEIAQQAPIAEAQEHCVFVAVDDPDLRRAMADVYRAAAEEFVLAPLRRRAEAAGLGDDPTAGMPPAVRRIMESAFHLSEHLHEVPVLVLAGSDGRQPREPLGAFASGFWGSVYPTIWSFQLALRARGLGSSLTCIHLHHAERMAEALDLPERFTQVALLPVAYTLGTSFRPAPRRPLGEVLRWGGDGP